MSSSHIENIATLLFSHSVLSHSLQPYGLQHTRPLCPSPSPKICPSSCPLPQWCHPAISSSDPLFSFCLLFPRSRNFPNELAVHIRWPKYWSFSLSISPSNENSGLISLKIGLILLPKGLSGFFSSTTVQKHQFFGAEPSLQSNSHIHTWLLEKPYLWRYGPLSAKYCLRFLICCLGWFFKRFKRFFSSSFFLP